MRIAAFMNSLENAKTIARINLEYLASSFGFHAANLFGEPVQNPDGSWTVYGEIYKGEYEIFVRFDESVDQGKFIFSVVVHERSTAK